jgi:hypothetical protein
MVVVVLNLLKSLEGARERDDDRVEAPLGYSISL